METLPFFEATRAQNLSCKAGLLTLEQAMGLFDAISGVYVCCVHAYGGPDKVPTWISPKLETLRQATKLSIAKARRIIGLWYKWTHPFHSGKVPDLSAVQGFIGML